MIYFKHRGLATPCTGISTTATAVAAAAAAVAVREIVPRVQPHHAAIHPPTDDQMQDDAAINLRNDP